MKFYKEITFLLMLCGITICNVNASDAFYKDAISKLNSLDINEFMNSDKEFITENAKKHVYVSNLVEIRESCKNIKSVFIDFGSGMLEAIKFFPNLLYSDYVISEDDPYDGDVYPID